LYCTGTLSRTNDKHVCTPQSVESPGESSVFLDRGRISTTAQRAAEILNIREGGGRVPEADRLQVREWQARRDIPRRPLAMSLLQSHPGDIALTPPGLQTQPAALRSTPPNPARATCQRPPFHPRPQSQSPTGANPSAPAESPGSELPSWCAASKVGLEPHTEELWGPQTRAQYMYQRPK